MEKGVCNLITLVINSNLGFLLPFPRYCHLYLKTLHWKLRPNRCRCRHGYYWQPIWSRQHPIGCYHRPFLKTCRL